MNLSRWLRKWWLSRQQHIESILAALLASREWGIGKALASLSRTVRRTHATITHRRFIPLLEELEPRYVFNVPVITGVTPDVGPVTGGAAVTLTGSGFTGTTAVSFGNGHPAGFLVVSDTTLRVTSPTESPGIVDILVTNASGQSSATTADQYTYTNQPSITAVSPSQGSTDGGNTVTITGLNLAGASSVLFGGKAATSFTDSKGQITAVAPAHAAGVVDVEVVTAYGATPTTATDEFTYVVPAPVIISVSPDSGSTHGGQQVTITGTDLSNATKVSFGGTPAVSFNVVSATQIIATAPPESAGTVNITVTTPGGTSAISTTDDFTYAVPAPTITGVNPGSGSTDGGTSVVITGTDLTGATKVLFGSTATTSFTVVSPTEIQAASPAGTAGSVDITVTTAGGTSAVSSKDQFTYTVPAPVITSLSPSSGSTDGGEQVLINGTDIGGATAVFFGTTPATSFQQVSNTQIAAKAPAALAGTVDVRVTTAGGKSAIVSADRFQYVAPTSASNSTPNPQPTITGVSSSGSSIIITGTNFTGATQVLFGKTAATSFTVNSATQITAAAPNLKPGTRVSVTVETPAGKSAPSTAASYVVASSNGSIVTQAAAPSSTPAGKPMLNVLAPAGSASHPLFSGGGGDGTGSAPTTAVSSTSWNHTTSNSYSSASGSGHYSDSGSWGYHYQMTVTADGTVIASYTANGGGHSHSSASWSPGYDNWSTSSTSWSNDHYFENIVKTVSIGTQGSNYETYTNTYALKGKNQVNTSYNASGNSSPSGGSFSGNSDYTGSGSATSTSGYHGNDSYTMPGGNGTDHASNGATAHYGYTSHSQSTLGSDGIWLSSSSMSNHGYGTSYSSLSGKYGYTLTSSPPTVTGSDTVSSSGSGHYKAKGNGGWSYHDKGNYTSAAGWQSTGAQASNSSGTSTATSKTNGSSHGTNSNGKGSHHGSFNFHGNGGYNYSGSATLGSDGIWITSGSMSTNWSGKGHGIGGDDASFHTDSAAGSSSSTGAGASMSSSTSGSTSSMSGASTMHSGVWTPVKGLQFQGDHGKATDSFNDGGKEKSVVVGDTLTGPWSASDNSHSNYSMTVKSVMSSGGQWTTTGTATEGGGGKGNDSTGEAGTESLKNTSSGKGVGSLTIKESDDGHSSGNYHAQQAMTKDGGWVSVSGSATSSSGSTSTSSDHGGGTSSSGTAGGDSSDHHGSAHGSEHANVNVNVTSKLGSGGIWITQGSVTISGGGNNNDSDGDKGKYKVSGDEGSSSSSGSGSGTGGSSATGSGSGGWETGSGTSTSGSGSNSSNTFNAEYSLDSSGNLTPVSGSMFATNTVTSHDSITGNGDFGSTLPGGSDTGTWNVGGNDHSSNTATVNATLGSDGSWTTTGTVTGGGGGSWSSGFGASGAFAIDTGSVSSGNWDDETGTVTESGGDNGGYNYNYGFSLGSNGSWQGSSGSMTANDSVTDHASDDETDSYGEDTNGVEVTGTKVEDDSVDVTATANDSWTLGTDGSWISASSSSNVTETVNDSLTNDFNRGNAGSGSDQGSLQETLTSSNGGTLVPTTLMETASGSFIADGTQASYSVNVDASASAPTTTITETNTADLNGLSSVSVNDIDSLDNAIVTAIAEGDNSSPVLGSLSRTYNSAGELLSAALTDGDGNTTAWTFNTAGQLTSRTLAYGTPEAATTSFAYDANGNLISVTDPDGNVTSYTYNAQNEETSMTNPLGYTQTMEYNAQGQLIEQTNRDGMYETYAYNAAGQMVQETWYAANGTETDQLNFSYNAAGQLVSASNGEGTYTFTYNSKGQVIGVTEPFGVSLSFAYDTNGNRVEVQDSFGGTTQSSYNAENQLVSELFSEMGQPTLGIDESYNADGTVASLTYYNGNNVAATTAYGYDSYSNITSILQTNGSGNVLGYYTYSYDMSGDELPSMTLPSGSTTSTNAGLLSAFLNPPEPGGSTVSETDNGVTTNYGYDASNQLVSYGNTTQSYDLNGNRNGPAYVIGRDNQLLSDGTHNYTYDADGNEATKTNVATGDKWTYGYNNADQLVSAVETSANGTVETQVVIKFDVFGNRLEEDVWTQSTGWTTTRFAYDAWNPRTPSGMGNENWKVWATLDGNNHLVTRYINGDALDQVFAQISAGGAVAWYLTDRLGSTRALVDNNGNVLDAITYDAWGNISTQTNSSAQPLFMFTGIAYDSKLRLYFNGNGGREYDPETGRFIEQDPTQFRAGDSNLYRYVGNDATNATDPSGLANDNVMLKGIGRVFVEWWPEQGIGEIKVIQNGVELIRFRWSSAAPKVIETITDHAGKALPGITANLMKQISHRVTHALRMMVEKAGGNWARSMVPSIVRAGYAKPPAPRPTGPGGATFGLGTILTVIFAMDATAGTAHAPEVGLRYSRELSYEEIKALGLSFEGNEKNANPYPRKIHPSRAEMIAEKYGRK